MEVFYADGCHDFLEQTTPENRAKINELLQKYKECVIECGDDFTTGIEIDIAEIELTDKELKAQKIRYNRAKEKEDLRKQIREME